MNRRNLLKALWAAPIAAAIPALDIGAAIQPESAVLSFSDGVVPNLLAHGIHKIFGDPRLYSDTDYELFTNSP